MPSEWESDEDRSLARAMTEQLLSDVESVRRDSYLRRLEIYSADVELAVERFVVLLDAARRYEFNLPCLILGKDSRPIPMDFGLLAPAALEHFWYRFRPEPPPYYWHWLTDWWRQTGYLDTKIVEVPPREALSQFRSNLEDFLAVRFSARKSDISQSPGLQFKVTTRHHGMRVYYSPAYFFTTDKVFGSPTTPVVQWIQPGRYVFGVKRPADALPRFDHGEYDIPPHKEARLQL